MCLYIFRRTHTITLSCVLAAELISDTFMAFAIFWTIHATNNLIEYILGLEVVESVENSSFLCAFLVFSTTHFKITYDSTTRWQLSSRLINTENTEVTVVKVWWKQNKSGWIINLLLMYRQKCTTFTCFLCILLV